MRAQSFRVLASLGGGGNVHARVYWNSAVRRERS